MRKRILLLNGPSSSGKSTLARCLQERLRTRNGDQVDVVSIDDFLTMNADDAIYEDDVYAVCPERCDRVRESLRRKDGVIVDHVITSERIYRLLLDSFAAYRLLLVRVTCPVSVLNERERQRGDRRPGSAEASAQYLYPQAGYDGSVDTHLSSTEACVDQILRLLV